MKTRIHFILTLIIICIWFGGCISPRVNADFDETANLSRFRTFKFTDSDNHQAESNPLYHSSMLDNTIHAQIAIELEKRGIQEDLSHPDMLIAYHTYTEKKLSSINNYYPMMYGGWGWGFYPRGFAPYPYGYWSGYNSNYEYTEGTLIIDAIDTKSKQMIWRGSISDEIDSPSYLHKKVITAVHLIFKKFPIVPNQRLYNDSRPLASKNKSTKY